MVLLTLKNIAKSFGLNKVLEDICLSVQTGDRLGLVGVNGSGKSTLMRIITGELEPDEGEVTLARGVRVGFLTQQADIDADTTILEEVSRVFAPLIRIEEKLRSMEEEMNAGKGDALVGEYARLMERYEREGGYEWRSRAQGVLAGLGFARDRQDQPAGLLSGGEKTRLCLARILLTQPELLILDEPTNHLDLASTQWLEDTLKSYRGTVLVISHDRYFLNEVCTCMAELRVRHLTQYRGNYDAFTVKREEMLNRQMREYEMQQAEIRRQQAIIERYRMYNREKSIRAAESREKRLNRMERLERPVDDARIRFSFTARRRSGDDVLMVRDLRKGFDGRTLFDRFSLTVRAGERVAIIGPNGVGKSTLLNCVTERLAPDAGQVIYGANVDVGYYDQQQSSLHPEKDVLHEVWDDFPRLDPDRVRGALALFLLTGDDVFQPIGTLSGGEKGRVALAKLMLRRDNLLILDEPTNHLDMDSREVLEHALDDFNGTLIAVSHDRYFINRVCDRVVEMRPDGVTEYLGNYDDYLEKKRRMEADAFEQTPGRTRTEIDRERRRERMRRASLEALKSRAAELESRIADAEDALGEIEAKLADPATYQAPGAAEDLSRAHAETKERIAGLYAQWEEAAQAALDAGAE